MTYTVSDIHGCYDKYRKLLKEINFSSDDILYVLGDSIDRGPDGFQVLLDMAQRPNVVSLLGNHEAMAIDAIPCALQAIQKGKNVDLDETDAETVDLWFSNGGEVSLADFLYLDAKQAQMAWEYLLAMPLYKEIKVGEREFVLLHGGLGNFSLSRPLEDYKSNEILWCRPKAETVYYPDKLLVLGHTPTQLLYGEERENALGAEFFRTNSFIDIDCGCVFQGGKLGCLCLDTMEEVYV